MGSKWWPQTAPVRHRVRLLLGPDRRRRSVIHLPPESAHDLGRMALVALPPLWDPL